MSDMAYVFTGLHHDPLCTECGGTGICPECGVLPEGSDCGLCGRDTPKYACEQCWPNRCEYCSGVGCVECKCYRCDNPDHHPNKHGEHPVDRVGPVAWDGSQVDTNLCRDCGGMGYESTTGCGECGRVTARVPDDYPPHADKYASR